MARYSEHDTARIFAAADAFRSKCLLNDGSLIFEFESVWRPETLDRLHKAFVATPDEGDRSFMDKFKDQIGQAGKEVIRLAAEILCVYFLFPSNVGGTRKRQVVNDVLGWTDDSLPDTHPVSAAFANGIGSGGQGYNTRRPFEIAFLIDLAIAWKKLPAERQAVVAADPWLFQEFVDSIEDAETKQLRHMLLYLFFPDHFERIASSNHKRRIIKAFSGLNSAEPEDEDRAILAIRGELERLLPHQRLDFYRSPLREAWYDESEGASAGAPLEVIQYKKQIVLFGPPRHGKDISRQETSRACNSICCLGSDGARQVLPVSGSNRCGNKRKRSPSAVAPRLQLRGLHPCIAHFQCWGHRVSRRVPASPR